MREFSIIMTVILVGVFFAVLGVFTILFGLLLLASDGFESFWVLLLGTGSLGGMVLIFKRLNKFIGV